MWLLGLWLATWLSAALRQRRNHWTAMARTLPVRSLSETSATVDVIGIEAEIAIVTAGAIEANAAVSGTTARSPSRARNKATINIAILNSAKAS